MQAGREIKFRALFQKKNGQTKWAYYGVSEKPNMPASWPYVIVRDLQFTGIHDDQDQGEEFYDGDIAEVLYEGNTHICKVKYEGCAPMFVADSLPDGFLWFTEILECDSGYWWAEGTKKIGNTYENPELLPAI